MNSIFEIFEEKYIFGWSSSISFKICYAIVEQWFHIFIVQNLIFGSFICNFVHFRKVSNLSVSSLNIGRPKHLYRNEFKSGRKINTTHYKFPSKIVSCLLSQDIFVLSKFT